MASACLRLVTPVSQGIHALLVPQTQRRAALHPVLVKDEERRRSDRQRRLDLDVGARSEAVLAGDSIQDPISEGTRVPRLPSPTHLPP